MVWTRYAPPMHVAPSLNELERQYTARFPNRPKGTDGALGNAAHAARVSDHNPAWGLTGEDYAVIRAVDLSTGLVTSEDKAAGRQSLTEAQQRAVIAAMIRREQANPVDRIHYIIHRFPGDAHTFIWARKNGWSPAHYDLEAAMPHDHHFHTSLEHTHAAVHDTSAWFDWGTDEPPVVQPPVVKHNVVDHAPPKPAAAKPTISVKALNLALKSGQKSGLVATFQKALISHGFTVGKAGADGYGGPSTQHATTAAQIKLCGAKAGTSGADGWPGATLLGKLGFTVKP